MAAASNKSKRIASYLITALNYVKKRTSRAANLTDITDYISYTFGIRERDFLKPLMASLRRGIKTGFIIETPGERYKLAVKTARPRRAPTRGKKKSKSAWRKTKKTPGISRASRRVTPRRDFSEECMRRAARRRSKTTRKSRVTPRRNHNKERESPNARGSSISPAESKVTRSQNGKDSDSRGKHDSGESVNIKEPQAVTSADAGHWNQRLRKRPTEFNHRFANVDVKAEIFEGSRRNNMLDREVSSSRQLRSCTFRSQKPPTTISQRRPAEALAVDNSRRAWVMALRAHNASALRNARNEQRDRCRSNNRRNFS